jgi:hypothetical protein
MIRPSRYRRPMRDACRIRLAAFDRWIRSLRTPRFTLRVSPPSSSDRLSLRRAKARTKASSRPARTELRARRKPVRNTDSANRPRRTAGDCPSDNGSPRSCRPRRASYRPINHTDQSLARRRIRIGAPECIDDIISSPYIRSHLPRSPAWRYRTPRYTRRRHKVRLMRRSTSCRGARR